MAAVECRSERKDTVCVSAYDFFVSDELIPQGL